ncbi:MAG: hypothetical protein MAG795_00715 [Candidatus Woesearchaeota archaeon]|nr:hypothetical protein [Candidatus Woesearchaeota archaeon]
MNKKVLEELNNQINEELASAYIYLSMSAYFESLSLSGFGHWMRKQADEEIEHAMKIFSYINERGARVKLAEIKKPNFKWDNPLETMKAAYNHELHISKRINFLVDLAREQKDHATENFLQWFVEEQVEEEASADEIVQKLKMVGQTKPALMVLDRRLSKRK